ncbi:hypothetical protein TRVA0_065S00320 [Trichomonascus vanleenenianus]|uniref:uncharacterized protein n=1 Tax=Trichomonascus vanleenenianus TaxID=2268995 RepID=UPI003ECB20AE
MEEEKGNEHVKSTDPKYMELVAIAVNGYNDGTFKTITEAANHVNVHRTTVGRHIKNQIQLRDRAFEKQQYLKYFVENSFAEFLVRFHQRVGIPLSSQLVRSLAFCVKSNADQDESKEVEQLKPPGSHWVKRFEQRSGAKFGLSIESPARDQRNDIAVQKRAVAQWIQDKSLLLSTVPPENVAYIDQIDLDSVLDGLPKSWDPLIADGSPENLSIFETVFADGTIAPGFVVTTSPGQEDSMRGIIDGLKIDGWGSAMAPREDTMPYFELLKHFDQVCKQQCLPGSRRVLFINLSFPQDEMTRLYLETNAIELISLPDNISHLLHPLNPLYFGPIKAHLYQEASKKISTVVGPYGVLRDFWLAMYVEKRREWTKQMITACFEKIGLFPLDLEKLSNQLPRVTVDICERYPKVLIDRTINIDDINDTIDEKYLSNAAFNLFAAMDRFLNSRMVPSDDRRKIIESIGTVHVTINDSTGKSTRYRLSDALESYSSVFRGQARQAFLGLLERGALPVRSSRFLECVQEVFENRERVASNRLDGDASRTPLLDIWVRLFESVMEPDLPVVSIQNDLATLYRAYEERSLRDDLMRVSKRTSETVNCSPEVSKRYRFGPTNG